jgi:small-conductance mechanosensitive channel
VLALVLALLLASIVTRVLKAQLGRRIEDPTLRYRSRRAVGMVVYALALLWALASFSDSVGRLTVVLGGIGAGVAFALQEVIASIAGWVALSLGGFYRVGDRVQLGGTRGDVIAVGLLRTTLVEIGQWVDGDLYSGRVVRVANSFVFKDVVMNYSGDFPFLWDEFQVPVRFGSDRGEATRLLEEALAEVVTPFIETARPAWAAMEQRFAVESASLEPMVMYAFNDNWIEYRLRYVVDFKRRRSIKHQLSARILDAIEASQGRVQLASATVEVAGWPPLALQGQLGPGS